MIISFRDREAARIWNGERGRRLPPWIQPGAFRKLRMLDLATSLGELARTPGNRLEALAGNRSGQHSLRINDQRRVCFCWTEKGARDVEIVDCHS